ncbi:MAG: cyclic nucleotide-binding domain-containing protein [Cytophagales bacterium]|nr:cyclic nucleotide-binding domain-containing protein [Cytophagales bacterium]
MRKSFEKFLGIDSTEFLPVMLLLANSFCIGAFLVSYDVAASTLFLDQFGTKYLPFLPILSGGIGVIATTIFSFFQRRFLFTNISLVIFACSSILVVFVYLGLEYVSEDWVKFVSYMLLGPLNSMFMLCFYGTVTRTFSLKREKHMINTVDQGQMVATAIGFFVVLFVSPYIKDVAKFMIVSTISGILAFIMLLIFVVVYGNKALLKERKRLLNEAEPINKMIANPYVRWLCMLFMASVMAVIFLEYSFLNVTVQKYTNENDLAGFLGLFGGLVTVFSFIMQTFVAERIIKMYGMKTSLILIPGTLGLFAVLASLIGTLFGYTIEAVSFVLFFLFICMSKLFLQSLKESFEDPIVKNLFIPLDLRTRFDIQIKVEGIFREFSVILAGIILTTLSLLHFFELIFFSYFLVLVCAFYTYVVIRLFIEYRRNLTNTLQNTKISNVFLEKKDYEVTDVLNKELDNPNTNTVIYTLKILEKLDPVLAQQKLYQCLNSDIKELREYSITRLQSINAVKAIEKLEKYINNERIPAVKQLAQQAINNLKETDTIEITPKYIYYLIKSKKDEERIFAATLLSKTTDDAYVPHVLQLLRDSDADVRFAAIIAAAQMDRHESWPILIEFLSSYTFCNVAAAALIASGEKILPTLEAAFYKTNQSATIQEKIVQIYGRIRGEQVIKLLWNKIDFPDKKIVNNVLMCLSSCGFKPDESQTIRIKQAIETDIGNSAWNMAALQEIPDSDYAIELKYALQEEVHFNFENIYMLLALIYDPQSIKLVKDNIDSATVEGIVYAVELLDVFLADELKPILFPLIQDIPQSERNELLQPHFPRQHLDRVEVLMQIINRDYNSINRWTKACAIYAYANEPNAIVTNDLVANLFNPSPLLRDIAAWAIYTIDKSAYKLYAARLPEHERKELDALFYINPDVENPHLPMNKLEKVFFLKNVELFKKVPGNILMEFVELVDEVRFKAGDTLLTEQDNGNAPIYILVNGSLEIKYKNQPDEVIDTPGVVFGETLILDTDISNYTLIAKQQSLVFKIDKHMFMEQIYDNFEIAKELIDVVNNKYSSHNKEINTALTDA